MVSQSSESRLLSALFIEVFQTEESAARHCEREAKRLGVTRPAATMVSVSAHARGALRRFHVLAEARGYGAAQHGTAIGRALSHFRQYGLDLAISLEKSYRGTLLGIHHGIGVVALLESAAVTGDDRELGQYCAEWLAERRALVAAAERDLSWFAEHPARATAGARSIFSGLR